MPVIVNMACGLANRMFQYAYYRYLLKTGVDARVDYFTVKTLAHEDVDWLGIFPNASYVQAARLDILRMGGGKGIVSKLWRRLLPGTTRVSVMPTAYSLYTPARADEDRYLLGVFQSASVAEAVMDEVKEAFRFRPLAGGANIGLGRRLGAENSVAVHVRKGDDYRQRIWYRNTCGTDYYRRAVSWMEKAGTGLRYYVFTDNPQWVRDNLKWLDYELVDWNPGAGPGAHTDMQLMSMARHNIISNSTYSWWGAFLNDSPGQRVVCPREWFNPQSTPDFQSTPLICQGWAAV